MAKTKSERKERKKAKALAEAKKYLFEANGLTPPPLRPHDEEPALRTPGEPPALRTPEEDTSRLSASSEEAVMDTPLSAKAKESAAVEHLIAQAGRFLKPDRPAEQRTGDSVNPLGNQN